MSPNSNSGRGNSEDAREQAIGIEKPRRKLEISRNTLNCNSVFNVLTIIIIFFIRFYFFAKHFQFMIVGQKERFIV